jgi:RNA polymerase sigma factor (sigma-70 family)
MSVLLEQSRLVWNVHHDARCRLCIINFRHRSLDRRKYLARRGQYAQSSVLDLELENQEARCSSNAPLELTDAECVMTLEKWMKDLSQNERQVFGLVIDQGLTMREAANRMGIPVEQARRFFYRCRQELRAAFVK